MDMFRGDSVIIRERFYPNRFFHRIFFGLPFVLRYIPLMYRFLVFLH